MSSGRRIHLIGGATAALLFAASLAAMAQGPKRASATLESFQEPPGLAAPGSGRFTARINHDETALTYTLSYANLISPIAQAHIHLGLPSVNGGIMAFLCTNLGNAPPSGAQACPASPATITGTITAVDIRPIGNQNFSAGDFETFLRALRAGAGYVNVHTGTFPGGEIRGQIRMTAHGR